MDELLNSPPHLLTINNGWIILSLLIIARAGKQSNRTYFKIHLKERASVYTKLSLSFLAPFWQLRCHTKEKKISFLGVPFSRHNNQNTFISISLKFRYRCANDFLVALLHIGLIHPCVKYDSHEWYVMKEEELSFPYLYNLSYKI